METKDDFRKLESSLAGSTGYIRPLKRDSCIIGYLQTPRMISFAKELSKMSVNRIFAAHRFIVLSTFLILLIPLSSFLFFSSEGNLYASSSEYLNPANKQRLKYIRENLNDDLAFKLMQDLYLEKPIFAYHRKFNDRNYIICYFDRSMDKARKFIVHEEFAGTWQIIHSEEIISGFYLYSDFKEANDDLLFYMKLECGGTMFGSGLHYVYSLVENELYNLDSSGPHSIVRELFKYNEIWDYNELRFLPAHVFSYLEEKLTVSLFTHIPDDKDLNLDLPINAHKLWELNNPNLHERVDESPGQWHQLNIKKYKVSDTDEFYRNGKENAPSYSEFGNNYYRIVSYFRSSLYVYDKREQESFLIWNPQMAYNSVHTVEFLYEHTIIIYPSELAPYIINLSEMKIMREE